MYGSIRDKLEDLLRGERPKKDPVIESHVSTLLRSLRAAEEVEPSPGFYARVIQRIEDSARDSIWAVFIDSPFGKRLAYASFMVTVLLGSYVIAQESRDGHLGGPSVIAQEFYAAPVVGSQAQQRDAVLMNFASDKGFPQ